MMRFLSGIFQNRPSISTTIDIFWSWKDLDSTLNAVLTTKSGIIILWTGAIWEKVQWFIDRSRSIQKSWFISTQKIILASDVAKESMQSEQFLRTIAQNISTYYKQYPVLIIRSSGKWDAHWVGIYESSLTINNSDNIYTTIKKVISSNDTPAAQEYRSKTGIKSDDFAVCIEPCIWNTHEESFWPELSWRAKTNTEWEKEIWLVLWQWWGVDEKSYFHITVTTTIKQSLEETLEANKYGDNGFIARKYLWDSPVSRRDWLLYNISHQTSQKYEFERASMEKIYSYNLEWLLQNIWTLDRYCKKPQYIERASMVTKNWWRNYITQIADISHEIIKVEFPPSWQVLWETSNILRSGEKRVNELLFIRQGSSFVNSTQCKKMLKEYNDTHQNYWLILSANLTFWYQKLSFNYFSNASFIIEVADSTWHQWHPASHYTWLLEATDILFSTTRKFPRINKDMWFNHKHMVFEWWAEPVIRDELGWKDFHMVQDKKKWLGKLYLME